MHRPMHGRACPSPNIQIRPHQANTHWHYMILLLYNAGRNKQQVCLHSHYFEQLKIQIWPHRLLFKELVLRVILGTVYSRVNRSLLRVYGAGAGM